MWKAALCALLCLSLFACSTTNKKWIHPAKGQQEFYQDKTH